MEVSKEGALHFFSFSGGVLCDPELFDHSFEFEGHVFSFLAPIRLGDGAWRPIPTFTKSRFVEIYPTADKVHDLFRLSANPLITDEGKPAILLNTGGEYAPTLPRDTFPVMIAGSNWSAYSPHAEACISLALEWVRTTTKQWWAGRSSESLTGNLHVLFELQNGSLYASPIPTCRQTSPFSGTQRLSALQWQEIIGFVHKGERPSPRHSFLADAVYFYLLKDFRVSLITLATAFESARDILSDKRNLRFNGSDLIRHVSREMDRQTGRSLERDDGDAFEFLKRVWIARGHLAHGKAMKWDADEQFGDAIAEHFFATANRVLAWFDDVANG